MSLIKSGITELLFAREKLKIRKSQYPKDLVSDVKIDREKLRGFRF